MPQFSCTRRLALCLLLWLKLSPKQVPKLLDVIVNTPQMGLDNNLDMVQILCGKDKPSLVLLCPETPLGFGCLQR